MRSHWDGMVQPCHFGLGEVDRYAGGAKEIAAQDEIVVDRCGRVEDMRGVVGNVQGATEFGQYQVGEFDGGSCLEVAAVVAKLYLACVSSVGPRGKALRLIMVCEPPESSRTTKGRKRDWPPIVLTATRVDGTKSLVRVESSALSVEALEQEMSDLTTNTRTFRLCLCSATENNLLCNSVRALIILIIAASQSFQIWRQHVACSV